jgi:hypothetical protein
MSGIKWLKFVVENILLSDFLLASRLNGQPLWTMHLITVGRRRHCPQNETCETGFLASQSLLRRDVEERFDGSRVLCQVEIYEVASIKSTK